MTYTHNQPLAVNTRIGVYEINDVSKIRRFDIIYRAWNHHLKERVVLHEYFPGDFAARGDDGLNVGPKLASEKESFEFGLKAFLNQAEILARIEHPNVAVTENILQLNGTAYLIVGFQAALSNSGLENALTKFDEAKIRSILVSILKALQKVHEHKIVHGGIHPGAILLNEKGEPVLTDFAAARLAIASRTGKPDSELSPGYAPAEQYEPAKALGPATDFYALGATMYHCLTHMQPVAAQDRLAAISKNEPDPMVLRASRLSAAYSVNLLETIDWMLRPNYKMRPQTADEIITALGQENAASHADVKTPPGQKAVHVVNTSQGANDRAWIIVLAGIIVLIGSGLWYGEKATENMDGTPGSVTDSPLSQQNIDQVIVESVKNEKAFVADAGLDQAPEPEKISEIHKIGILEGPKKQLTKVDKKTTLISHADDNQTDVGKTQQPAVADNTPATSTKQAMSEKAADNQSVRWYLAAAENAMREMRFTTPVGNSAYEYYQTVLVSDPDNAEALAGLQKIVDAYIRLIDEARTEGLPNTARVYLQRAEAVLPEEPKLRSIRAELAE